MLAVERRLLRRFDRVYTISGRMLARLKTKGAAESQCVLFPNWVDTKLIHPIGRPSLLRDELGIGPHELVALYSGNMGQKQGLEIVIDAADVVMPSKLTGMIFGPI